MKTLDEHNEAMTEEYFSQQKANVACPKCGKELIFTSPYITLTSFPPQKAVHCECGYQGYMVV